MRSELVIRFDYGQVVPWVRRVDHARVAIAGPDGLCLRAPVEVHGEEMTTVSEFTLRAGERIPFVLTWFPSHEPLPAQIDAEVALAETEEYWLEWAGRCTHTGDYHEEIHRSLLLLKALTYAPTGGIVAAPTTSLPGGARRRAQLGLPVLLAPRRDPHAGRHAPRRLQRRGTSLAPVAAPRGRRRPGRRPDHVRHRRRAPARGARARLAPGLRRIRAGARRERRVGATAARRLRRDDRRPVPDPRPRRAGRRQRLVADAEAARVAGGRLAATGRRDLGGARPVPALHPLEGDGVGRVRSGRPRARASSAGKARSTAGGR